MGDLEISNNFIQPSASSILLSPAQSQVVLHNLSEYQAVSHSLTQSPTDPYILTHSNNLSSSPTQYSPTLFHPVPHNLKQSSQSHIVPIILPQSQTISCSLTFSHIIPHNLSKSQNRVKSKEKVCDLISC